MCLFDNCDVCTVVILTFTTVASIIKQVDILISNNQALKIFYHYLNPKPFICSPSQLFFKWLNMHMHTSMSTMPTFKTEALGLVD